MIVSAFSRVYLVVKILRQMSSRTIDFVSDNTHSIGADVVFALCLMRMTSLVPAVC